MKNPPIHIIQNMDDVGRLDPQSQNLASYLIEDSIVFISPHKMSMMKPVEGTVSRSNDNFIADHLGININDTLELDLIHNGINNLYFLKFRINVVFNVGFNVGIKVGGSWRIPNVPWRIEFSTNPRP